MWKIEPSYNTYLIIFRYVILEIFFSIIKFYFTRISLIRSYLTSYGSICLKSLIIIFLKQICFMKSVILSKLYINTLSELCSVVFLGIVLVRCHMNLLIISLVFKQAVLQSLAYSIIWNLFKLKFLILRIVCVSW